MGIYAKTADKLKKKLTEEMSTSSTGRGAGSAAASGGAGRELDFLQRLQNETKKLYSQQSGPSRTPAPAAQNLYAAAAQRMTPGLTGAQRQMIAERTPATPNLYSQAAQRMMPTGDTWEDTQALGRELTPRMTYSDYLARNMNTAASGGEVTPQMQAELQRAEQAERAYKERRRQQERRWVEQQMAAQGNLYTPQPERTPTPGLTGAQRQMIAERGEAISENAPLTEVKARLPGLKDTYDAARQNYQQLMDRNMRLANETGAVPPEMVAELYRAEQAQKQAEQRYNAALARNEELSYAEKMGEVKTDLSGIAQLLARREEVNRNGFAGMGGQNNRGMDESRNELAAIDAQIEAVRENLRREGLSEDEIQSLIDYQVKQKNAEDMKALYKRYYQEAAGNTDFENWVMNTSMGLYGGASYIDMLTQGARGLIRGADPITGQARQIDYNSELQGFYHGGEAVMQGEMDKLLKQYGERDEEGNLTGDMERMGRIRAGAYQLSVSMGQSAAVAGLTAIGAPCAMLLLSGNAATQTAHQMHEAGYSDGDALLMGAISGAAEYVTERIGMDQLFKTRDLSTAKNVVKTLLGNIVNQSMAEGGEEVLSTVINTLADLLVNQDKSELAKRYQELLAQGMTPEEAERAAAREWMQGAWQDFYMGALSGGLFGMGGTAFVSGRNAITDRQTGQKIIDAGTVQDVLEAAKKLDGKISDAAAMPEISDTPSARQLGAAKRGLERAQVMENMRAELESRGEENVSPELLSALYNSSLEQEQRLTREEQKALRGSKTAMELAAEWSEQRGDNSVPAPFEGLEDILRGQMEQKENAPTEEDAETQEQSGPYASIETLPDGKKYVKADRQVVQGDDPEAWGRQITNYINSAIRQGRDVPIITVDGDTLLLTRDSAGKAGFRNDIELKNGSRPMTDSEYRAKLNAEAHIDELGEVSRMIDRNKPPVRDKGERHDFARNGWKYRQAFFMDHDGTYYRITISTGVDGNLYTVYNVGEMNRRSNPTFRGSSAPRGGAPGASSNPTILQQDQNSNNYFSQEGMNNGEQSGHGASENGDAGVRAGEQGQFPGEGEGTQPGGQGEVRQSLGQSDVESLRGQDVTPAELGIRTGSDSTAIHIQTREEMSDRAKEAERLAQSRGYTAVPYTGSLGLGDGHANAVIQDGMICFRTDAVDRNGNPIDPVSLVEHEFTHPFTENNEDARKKGMGIIGKHYSREVIDRLKDGYRETYKDLYDFEHMSEDEIMAAIENELFGDAYSGSNFFSGNTELKEEMQNAFPEIRQGRNQTQEGAEKTRGPTRAAVDQHGNVIVDEDVTSETLKPVLESIEKSKQDQNFTFAVKKYTPSIYVERCHLDGARSLVMHSNKAKIAMRSGPSNHKLGSSGLMKVIENLDRPEYIIYQTSGRNAGHYVAIVTIDNKSAVAAVDFGGYRSGQNATVNGEEGYYDVLITAYNELLPGSEFETFEDYVTSLIADENNDVVYDREAEEKTEDPEPVALSEQLSRQASESSKNNIPESTEKSNTKNKPLDQRVSGDQLLDAQDLIETVEAVGADVDENGYITLYHRTSPAVAEKIQRTGRMTAKEDGLFFSTKKEGGQNEGFGSSVIELKIPAEAVVLDDIFDDEAHLRVPLEGGRWSKDVSEWLVTNEQGDTSSASEETPSPQGEGPGRASAEVDTSAAEAQQEKERKEAREALRAEARALTEGRGIDIMPEEGEEAVSSANGLNEEDNAELDRRNGFDASVLFGMPSAEERAEARATEKATKEGNEALAKFAEEMPEDPMDLYQEYNPVNARKGGGNDGNGPKAGQEKISTEKAAEKKTLGQKISDAWHRFIRSMANEGDAIHQAGRKTGNKALDGMYFYAKAATQRAQQWIQGQRMSFDLSESGKGLNAIFDPIRKKGENYYRDFQLYMYHMLNVERMSRSTEEAVTVAQETVNQLAEANPRIAAMSDEQLRNKARQYQEGGGLGYEEENGELIYEYWQAKQELARAERAQNKPVFGWDVDADRSRETARDLLAAHPEFEDLAQEVYDYVDALLQYRVDAGLITKEDMAKLKATYPHYVPVMYEMAEDAAKIQKGNMQVSSTVKSAEGGDSRMEPLHLALARQTLAVMKNAGYQQLGSEVMNEYRNNQEAMSRYVTNMEESDSVWDESMADNDDVNVPYKNVISVLKDGKRYDLTLSDDMSFAFQSLNGGQSRQDWKMMQKANDLFKKLCTAWNPLFMITNPIRDVQDALFYSTDTKRWMGNYPKAISQIAHSGRYWQMYQGMGGVNNSYFDWATGENSGKMGKIEALNMAIEQAPRLAEFMTVLQNAERKNGQITQADLMEAFDAAAEITTNFGRSGTLGKWINRNLVPFWNPGVQGLSKAVRTATETRGFKAWGNLAIKAAALGMLPALLNGLLYRDDDEWDKIDDQMKMEYYLFKTSDGVWIKVPKGRVLAALSMPVVGAQESLRGDEVEWGELMKQAFGSVAPNNPLETNLLSQAVRAKLFDPDDPGKTWYGGNIESKRLQSYAPGERYDESTDAISKWLGGKLNLSPKKINYIIDQYSGVLGDLILPYLTPKAERGINADIAGHSVSVPLSNAFMSRFTLDTVTNNTISEEYYGLLDELGYDAKGGDNPAAIAERFMNRAGGQVSDIYAQIREIENDKNLTDKEKTALTRELRKQLNEYEKQIIADAQEYLTSAREYMDQHPEFDYTDDEAVDAFVEGYNSMQTNEKYYIDADQAAGKMKDEVYREVNREHFGAEYALQVYNKDVYERARTLHDESGVSYDDYYDFYFGTRYLFGDKDAEGNTIEGTKTDKVVSFLEGMDITDAERNALYHADNHNWNYPTGITEYLRKHPEYDFMDDRAVQAFMEGYNSQQTNEKYFIDAEAAKGKMRSEAYREIYREQYGAEYALEFFDRDVHEKAQGLNKSAGLSYDDYYDFYFGTRYMTADKDEKGNSISGSKKEKVVGFINDMDITDEQKDALYLAAGYKENSLKTTPWNGGSGKYSGGSGGRGGGGGRKARAPKEKAVKGSGKIQLPKVAKTAGTGGSGAGGIGGKADASLSLIEIIDEIYGGSALLAAMDGGAKARGRTKVDFEL